MIYGTNIRIFKLKFNGHNISIFLSIVSIVLHRDAYIIVSPFLERIHVSNKYENTAEIRRKKINTSVLVSC